MRPLRPHDPRQLGPYTVLGRLGTGGMGTVYLGREEHSGSFVAIKTLRQDLVDDAEALRRFEREVEAASSVTSVGLAKIVAYDVAARPPWYASDYVAGARSLADLVSEAGRLDPARTRQLAGDLAAAIAALHDAGVLHRDVKPANVLSAGGRFVLIDLGLAKRSGGESLTTSDARPHTPGWHAPEVETEPAAFPADVYGWGLTVAHAATGKPPQELRHELTEWHGPGPPALMELPDHVTSAIRDALAAVPAARPTARELTLRITEPEAADLVSTSRDGPPTRPSKALRRRIVVGAALVATIILLGVQAAVRENNHSEHQQQIEALTAGRIPDQTDVVAENEFTMPWGAVPLSAGREQGLQLTLTSDVNDGWEVAFPGPLPAHDDIEGTREGSEVYRWAVDHGAADLGQQRRFLTIQNTNEFDVVILGIVADVSTRRAPLDGSVLLSNSAGAAEYVSLTFDLDSGDRVRASQSGEPFFDSAYISIASDEVVVLDLHTTTTTCYCQWEFMLDIVWDGTPKQVRVGDSDGRPFAITAVSENTHGYYEWTWWEETPTVMPDVERD